MKVTRRNFIGTSAAATAGITMIPGIGSVVAGPLHGGPLTGMPTIPYGAVYFRKSFPPREDWERDYKAAADIGINSFRHWFMWSAIEVAPGKFDWEDYDRQLDLAAKYGMKTVIADILCTAPEWAFKEFPHAKMEDAEGRKSDSAYTVACAVGGWPGLCLDNEDVRELAEGFLRELVSRYKDHPGLGAYDTFNEQNHFADAGGCWCDGSAEKWRGWVREKYGSLDAVAEAWNRYSYRNWEDIEIPRHSSFYGDALDWILFRIDNAHRIMKWRVDTIKSIDPVHPVTAHGYPHWVLSRVGPATYQPWKAAELVDVFGHSGGCNHEEWSRNRWEHWLIEDVTRSSSRGKPFWHAEMPAGYTWRAHGGPDMDNGRMAKANDIKLYSMIAFAGGATGVYSPRWRPLLNGIYTGHFAFCNMDGSHTDRAEMGGRMATWANERDQKLLWEAKPVKGDLGIIVVPESQIQCWLLEGSTDHYSKAARGAYQGFLFNSVQADFVYEDEIINCGYEVLYLPHPLLLPERVANDLKEYVRKGGILISEGCPAYYGDHGRAGENQPNYGLDELFGAIEERVQFTPDLLEDMKFSAGSKKLKGGVYLQAYKPTTGKISGTYEDGSAAVIDNHYGSGKTRLIGTSPGYGNYGTMEDDDTYDYFGSLLKWAGKKQHVKCSDSRLVARLHTGRDYKVLWVISSAREDVSAEIELSERWGSFDKHEIVVNNGSVNVSGRSMSVTVPARETTIVKFS